MHFFNSSNNIFNFINGTKLSQRVIHVISDYLSLQSQISQNCAKAKYLWDQNHKKKTYEKLLFFLLLHGQFIQFILKRLFDFFRVRLIILRLFPAIYIERSHRWRENWTVNVIIAYNEVTFFGPGAVQNSNCDRIGVWGIL